MQNRISDKNRFYKFKVIVHPYTSARRLLLFEDHLVFESDMEKTDISYSLISSVVLVRSARHKENNIRLMWGDQKIYFSVQGLAVKEGFRDIALTERVASLISLLRDKSISIDEVPKRFPELTPRGLRIWIILRLLKLFSGAFPGLVVGIICAELFNRPWLLLVMVLGWPVLLFMMLVVYNYNNPYSKGMRQKNFYLVKKDIDEAIQELFKLSESYPNHVTINLELAKCYYRKNNWAKARHYSEEVLSLYPKHKKAQELLDEAVLNWKRAAL